MLRKTVSLNGVWDVVFDDQEKLGPNCLTAKGVKKHQVNVPGVWEEVRPFYDGQGFYGRTFDLPASLLREDRLVHLKFGAVNYFAEVFLNGKKVGQHEGGYTPFTFDITKTAVAQGNRLAVRVIDPPRRRRIQGFRSGAPLSQSDIPTWKAGWYHTFGGLWQPVEVYTTAKAFVSDVFVQPQADMKTVVFQVTVENHGPAQSFDLTVAMAPRSGDEATGLTLARKVRLKKGTNVFKLQGEVKKPHLWSPDDPFLYTATATLSSGGAAVDELAVKCGIRYFTTEDGVFKLNGKRIALRGFLQQGIYPRHIVFPDSLADARKELMLLKNNGMNFIRAHLKAPPIALDLADELGILLLEEPPIGWIENTEHTVPRCVREVEELVLRDRNRPSVIMWGLLNEATHYRTFTHEQLDVFQSALSKACVAMDPTRLVIENSGGSLGGHSDESTVIARMPYTGENVRVHDLHAYCGIPLSISAINAYRRHGNAGADVKPDGVSLVAPGKPKGKLFGKGKPAVFISEFGAFENPPDFDKTLARYSAADKKKGLEDYAQYQRYYDSLKEQFKRAKLGEIFGTVQKYIKASQDMNKENIRAILSAMRANPRNSGWVFTQLADASGEIFGAFDLWRQPRTWFADMAAACVTPLIVPHVTKRVVAPGETLGLNVRLVNEDRTGLSVTWKVTVKAAGGRTLFTKSDSTRTKGWVQEVLDVAIDAPKTAGRVMVQAEVRQGSKVLSSNYIRFSVIEKAPRPVDRISMFDYDNEIRPTLQALGIPQIDKGGNNYRHKNVPVVMVMRPHHHVGLMYEYKNQLRRICELGGAGLVLEAQAPMLYNELLPKLVRSVSPMRNLLYMRPSPIWDGLPTSNGFMDFEFADALAGRANARNNPEDILALGGTSLSGGLCAHMWTGPEVYQWGSLVDQIPIGRGNVILCQFQLVNEARTNPVAARLLSNLIRYTASLVKPGGEARMLSRCIDPV